MKKGPAGGDEGLNDTAAHQKGGKKNGGSGYKKRK